MKIFISWSKKSSNSVAYALKGFISKIFPKVEFFISSEDIYAGEKWFNIISQELLSSQLAIICLTQENRFSKWLDFESGAIAFNSHSASVCPFLFDIKSLDEGSPLNSYQVTKNTKEHLFKLIKTISLKSGSETPIEHVEVLFDKYFNDLNKKLSRIKSSPQIGSSDFFRQNVYPTNIHETITNKVFIGTPMASIDSSSYAEIRSEILELIKEIKLHCKYDNIYSPVEQVATSADFQGPEKSLGVDFEQLKQSEYYIFLYPQKVVSSVLVEIGYAIALIKKTIILVEDIDHLPFLLKKADKQNSNIKIYEYENFDKLKKLIREEGTFFFKFDKV